MYLNKKSHNFKSNSSKYNKMRLNFCILFSSSDIHLIVVKYLQNTIWSWLSVVSVNPSHMTVCVRTFLWCLIRSFIYYA